MNAMLEKEANYFAMCLLMPRELVIKDANLIVWDYTSDKPLKELADLFEVSTTAMALRLAQLKYFSR